MNYPESETILEEIKKANKVLINCHRGPDSDSVGSALALSKVVESLGKESLVICPSETPSDLKFLSGAENIKRIDYATFNFENYDLFLVIDSSNYAMASGSKEIEPTVKVPMIVIDHHLSNEGFGKINLIDSKMTSTGELLYKIFEDWEINLTPEMAECLLTGIIGDTGCFMYQDVGEKTLRVAANLIDKGANKDKIVYNLFRTISFNEVKIWGKIIENMQIDSDNKFVWSALPASVYKNLPGIESAKEDSANLFFSIVRDTDFGAIMEEREDGAVSVSFRSRSGFDVSEIAKELGGGGHKAAAGARVEGDNFDQIIEKVLTACRKYASKN